MREPPRDVELAALAASCIISRRLVARRHSNSLYPLANRSSGSRVKVNEQLLFLVPSSAQGRGRGRAVYPHDTFIRDCLVIEYPVHKVFARRNKA